MPIQRPFSTTRKHVVAETQHVRVELDKLTASEVPMIWSVPRFGTVKFLAPRVLIYTVTGDLAYNTGSDSFMLKLPNGDNDTVSITINPDFAQGPEQQAREAVLPTGGSDPQAAVLQAKIDAAKKALA